MLGDFPPQLIGRTSTDFGCGFAIARRERNQRLALSRLVRQCRLVSFLTLQFLKLAFQRLNLLSQIIPLLFQMLTLRRQLASLLM